MIAVATRKFGWKYFYIELAELSWYNLRHKYDVAMYKSFYYWDINKELHKLKYEDNTPIYLTDLHDEIEQMVYYFGAAIGIAFTFVIGYWSIFTFRVFRQISFVLI